MREHFFVQLPWQVCGMAFSVNDRPRHAKAPRANRQMRIVPEIDFEDLLKGKMLPALERGGMNLTELALRLLVVSDHRLGAANVTGEDHGVSLLRVKQRKAQPFIFRRNFNAVISASGRRVSHCCSLCCPSRAFRTLTDPQTSE